MKPLFLVLLTSTLVSHARLPDKEAWRHVDAIRIAEGNPNYGVLSVRTVNPRQVCFNTVQNTHDRWLKAGRPGAFLDFLARRYCPPSVDPVGHRNWKRNVKSLLTNSSR